MVHLVCHLTLTPKGSLNSKPALCSCDSFSTAHRTLSSVYLKLSFKTRLVTTSDFSGLQYWTFPAAPLPILLSQTGGQDFGQVGLFQREMLFISTPRPQLSLLALGYKHTHTESHTQWWWNVCVHKHANTHKEHATYMFSTLAHNHCFLGSYAETHIPS